MSAGFPVAAGAVVDDVPMLNEGFSPGTRIVMVECVGGNFVAISVIVEESISQSRSRQDGVSSLLLDGHPFRRLLCS